MMEKRVFNQDQLMKRKKIMVMVREMAEDCYKRDKCVKQAGIIVNDKMEIIAKSYDNRVNNELDHATMCLINLAAGLGDYILTGLDGEFFFVFFVLFQFTVKSNFEFYKILHVLRP